MSVMGNYCRILRKGGTLPDLSEIDHFNSCSETKVEENGDGKRVEAKRPTRRLISII